jgi:hypothetical protein
MDSKESYQALHFILKAEKYVPQDELKLASKRNWMRADLWSRSAYKGKFLLAAAASGSLERTKFLVEQCSAPLYVLDRETSYGPIAFSYLNNSTEVFNYLMRRRICGIKPSIWNYASCKKSW